MSISDILKVKIHKKISNQLHFQEIHLFNIVFISLQTITTGEE